MLELGWLGSASAKPLFDVKFHVPQLVIVLLTESVTTPFWLTMAPSTVVQAPLVMLMVPRASILPVQ